MKLFQLAISSSLISLMVLASCHSASSDSKKTTDSQINDVDTAKNIVQSAPEPPAPTINYVAWNLKKNDSLRKIVKNIKGDSLEVLRQINRTDKKYWNNKDTFLIPEPFSLELLDYSLFPKRIELIKDIEKMVIFSYPLQMYGVYSNGQLIKWGATNMGKQSTPTPTGLFFANWKGRKIRSTVNSSWVLEYNFNINNLGGVGWHQYEMPGYPASHSCLRMFLEDAKWLYDYANQWQLENGKKIANGTPVLVFGEYPWKGGKPWFNLIKNPEELKITEKEMNDLINPHLNEMINSEKNRIEVKNKKEALAAQNKLNDSTSTGRP